MLIFLLINVYLLTQRLDASLQPYKGLILPFSLTSMIIFAAFILAMSWRRERVAIVLFVMCTVASYVALFASVSYKWDQVSPWRSFGLEARAMLRPGTQLAWYKADGRLPYGVPSEDEKVIYEYYVGRPVPFVGQPGELGRMAAQGPTIIVMRDRTFLDLQAHRPEIDLQRIQTHSSGWMLVQAKIGE